MFDLNACQKGLHCERFTIGQTESRNGVMFDI